MDFLTDTGGFAVRAYPPKVTKRTPRSKSFADLRARMDHFERQLNAVVAATKAESSPGPEYIATVPGSVARPGLTNPVADLTASKVDGRPVFNGATLSDHTPEAFETTDGGEFYVKQQGLTGVYSVNWTRGPKAGTSETLTPGRVIRARRPTGGAR